MALLVGVLIGWFAFPQLAMKQRSDWKKGKMLERFSRELQLTPEQKEKVGEVMRAKRGQMDAFRREMKPKFDEMRAASKAEIRKLLTPDQQEKFDRLEARWEERRKKRHPRWSE